MDYIFTAVKTSDVMLDVSIYALRLLNICLLKINLFRILCYLHDNDYLI